MFGIFALPLRITYFETVAQIKELFNNIQKTGNNVLVNRLVDFNIIKSLMGL